MERRVLVGSLFAFLPQGSAEAVRLRTCFDNVCLIGEPVEHGLAEPGIGKDLRPLGERQAGGHDQRGTFTSFGDDLEQELGPDLGPSQVVLSTKPTSRTRSDSAASMLIACILQRQSTRRAW